MQDAAVLTATDDGVVGNIRLVALEFMQQLGHHLVFLATRLDESHGALVRVHGNLR